MTTPDQADTERREFLARVMGCNADRSGCVEFRGVSWNAYVGRAWP